MSDKKRGSRAVENASKKPSVPHDDSSKSTPSTDPTETSSTGQGLRTPATPFSPSNQSPNRSSFKMPASPATGESAAKQAKVAIPRLKRNAEGGPDVATKAGGRHRVTHACEPCRHRKTKCSGERPTCRHCTDFKIPCFYADGKRDRVKKQFGSMQDKVAEYERILRELSYRVDERDADMIRSTLARTQLDSEDNITEHSLTVLSLERDGEESGAESEASGGAGSTGALDRTEEDFTRESARATGFMGKNSDVTWLQRLRQENKYGEGTTPDSPNAAKIAAISGPSLKSHHSHETPTNESLPEADDSFTIQQSSYHLNDMAISTYEHIDPYELPTTDHAQRLFTTYMLRTHPSFPIVGQENLSHQFDKFINADTSRAPTKWLAIMNLIFAIGAKYSHVIQADWQGDDRDHLIYFNRARMLSLDLETIFQHPDLQMIQILGLMAVYLLSVDQVNRAWTICGLAIRQATALGLNMRNESADLSNELKEIRYRVWWALYVMEHRLCTLTGRVNCILDDHVTTPLPVPLAEREFKSDYGVTLLGQEHQAHHRAPASNTHTPSIGDSEPSSRSVSKANESRSPSAQQGSNPELDWASKAEPGAALYFLYLVQLARITQDTFHKLYNPSAVEGKWSDIQQSMSQLDSQLDAWYRSLRPAFDFKREQRDRTNYEARIGLGFYYYATKMVVHRPCLCRLDRKIPGQSERSKHFNHRAALKCVAAAQDQLALIPDAPHATGLLKVGPWTSLLHLLVQSATVIMLEISFRVHHMPEQADELIGQAKKAINWLHALGEDSLAGARAWKLCDQMLRDAAQKIGRPINDLPVRPPRAMTEGSHDTNLAAGLQHDQTYPQNTSGSTTNQNQSTMFAQSNPMSMSNMVSGMPNFNTAVMFDPLIRYDEFQYLPTSSGVDPTQMAYPTSANMMPYQTASTDVDMSFMNQFTEQHGQQQQQQSKNASGRGASSTGFD